MLGGMQMLEPLWQRLQRRGRKAVVRALRLTGAATAAYLAARWVFPTGDPVLAPLTALLVVQVTLYKTLTAGLRRIVSVVAGVVVAVVFSELAGLTWWSLAAIVAAAILIGQLLRLREHLLEAPISAMLVLSLGGGEAPASDRILETLVGAGVGVLYNVLLPGPVQSRTAGEAVEQFADQVAALLRRMGTELADGMNLERADAWLDEARRLSRRVAQVDTVLSEAEESRRLNVRALASVDAAPLLRSGLETLEHTTVALRSLCRAVVDHTRSVEADPYSPLVRDVIAVLLRDLSDAMAAFGRLVHEEAEGEVAGQADRLAVALEAVGEARARLTDLALLDRPDDASWELYSVLLASVSRMLREIDVQEWVRRQERRRAQRPATEVAVDRLRSTSQVAVAPVRRQWRAGRSFRPRR